MKSGNKTLSEEGEQEAVNAIGFFSWVDDPTMALFSDLLLVGAGFFAILAAVDFLKLRSDYGQDLLRGHYSAKKHSRMSLYRNLVLFLILLAGSFLLGSWGGVHSNSYAQEESYARPYELNLPAQGNRSATYP